MRAILAILMLVVTTACSAGQLTEEKPKVPEVKKVCINVWDAKLNKEVQKCKTMKVHQKHEGTAVPPKEGSNK